MADQDEIERIQAYIKQHQATYSRDALRRKLLDSGYNPTAVDQVLAELDEQASRTHQRSGWFQPGQMYLGLVAFGPLNLALVFLLSSGSAVAPPVLLIAIVIALSALAFWRRMVSFAAGLLVGYALLTIMSRGTCTLLTTDSLQDYDSLLQGLIFYPATLLVLGIILGIYSGSRRQRNR